MSGTSVPPRTYLAVFLALMGLTAATVAAAFVDLGRLNLAVALLIAGGKAALVAVYFMHLRWSGRDARLFAVGGLVWLLILVSYTLGDYLSRDWIRGWLE